MKLLFSILLCSISAVIGFPTDSGAKSCSLEGEENVIVFLLDASDATHRKSTFNGLKQFVENAKDLIHNQNEVAFVAYGGESTSSSVLKPGWTAEQYQKTLNEVANGYRGVHTNCADGFDEAGKYLIQHKSNGSQVKRVVIHIGDGTPTGVRHEEAKTAYAKIGVAWCLQAGECVCCVERNFTSTFSTIASTNAAAVSPQWSRTKRTVQATASEESEFEQYEVSDDESLPLIVETICVIMTE